MAKRKMPVEGEAKTVKEEKIETKTEVVKKPKKKEEPNKIFGTVVGCTRLNVRKQPSLQKDVITTITTGTKVEVLKDTDDWYKVKLNDGQIGYCMKKFIFVTSIFSLDK